jgi:hypothetical protein
MTTKQIGQCGASGWVLHVSLDLAKFNVQGLLYSVETTGRLFIFDPSVLLCSVLSSVFITRADHTVIRDRNRRVGCYPIFCVSLSVYHLLRGKELRLSCGHVGRRLHHGRDVDQGPNPPGETRSVE